MTDLKLGWGRSKGLPAGLTAAWGARLIWPADLVHNRQDMVGDETERRELEHWLNGVALQGARDTLRHLAKTRMLMPGDDGEVLLYGDDRGKIIGSPQASHGYVYVAAWLFEHIKPKT